MPLLVALNPISDLELIPLVKRDAALSILAHLLDVFLLVLERSNDAYGGTHMLVRDSTYEKRYWSREETYHHE